MLNITYTVKFCEIWDRMSWTLAMERYIIQPFNLNFNWAVAGRPSCVGMQFHPNLFERG